VSLFRWLWRGYLSRHRALLFVALVLMALEGAALGLFAWMMAPMFDRVFVQGDTGALWVVGLTVMGIFMARALTSMGQRILITRIAESTALALRSDLLAHLMAQEVRFFQANPPGALIERLQGDVQAVNSIWAGIVTGLGRDLVAVISLFGVAVAVDWRWTAIALVGIPLLVLPSLMVQRVVRKRALAAREVAARMATRLDEVFHGIAAVKLNALEAWQSARYVRLLAAKRRAEVRSVTGQAAIPALIDIMTGIGFLGVLIYGGGEIIAGDKSVGQFMSFFTAMSLAFEPLRRLGNLTGMWQAAGASVTRIRELLDTVPTIVSPAQAVAVAAGAPEIVFDDVRLSYDGQPVLRGLSFVAEAGRTTALVGPSGAGKTTVFHLLTRLVAAESGAVRVGGVPVEAMGLAELRGMIAVVAQDAALFDDSLRDNIVLGQEVAPERLAAAVQAAHLDEVVAALPAGLESGAGPRGSALSGGQRQRVAIARAVLRDTPVLLLDEATSALDTRSEALVQEALERLSAGRTTLVIAHRLSTVRAADRIVVIEAGRVVDQGTHAELLARGGLYADLHALQLRDAP
jgi:subfamily B ATP-binding cassette protein MsbA